MFRLSRRLFSSSSKPDFHRLRKTLYGEHHTGESCRKSAISRYDLQKDMNEIAAFFLGPKAENEALLKRFVFEGIESVASFRKSFHPEDVPGITEISKRSPEYLETVDRLSLSSNVLFETFNRYAIPFHSLRYQGHMLWDVNLPAAVGYFTGMLHNSNNVSPEVSAFTTYVEKIVGEDMTSMLGYDATKAFGHITADGTIANGESIWSRREAKYLPLSMLFYLEEHAKENRQLDNLFHRLKQKTVWQLLNMTVDDIFLTLDQLAEALQCSSKEALAGLTPFRMNAMGTSRFQAKLNSVAETPIAEPVIFCPATCHYSWPKLMGMFGLGQQQCIRLPVDLDGRMSISALHNGLQHCLDTNTPVLLTVVVPGATEDSAMDDISAVLHLREQFAAKGLVFDVHADAAWGGYLISTIRLPYSNADIEDRPQTQEQQPLTDAELFVNDNAYVPLSQYAITQLKHLRHCDSITCDSHKLGYAPYPAGSLCYRDGRLKDLLMYSASYIGADKNQLTMGVYGIEGSKPGAAATSVFMSHSVIRPTVDGFDEKLDNFSVIPLCRLPAEKQNKSPRQVYEQLKHIQSELQGRTSDQIYHSPEKRQLFNELGPDQNILCFSFNFRLRDGTFNKDTKLANRLTQMVYDKLHMNPGDDIRQFDIFVSHAIIEGKEYGQAFMNEFARRIGLVYDGSDETDIVVLRSVVMDPWLASVKIDHQGNSFFHLFSSHLRRVVSQTVDELLDSL